MWISLLKTCRGLFQCLVVPFCFNKTPVRMRFSNLSVAIVCWCYCKGLPDFAYPWKASLSLWSNIWRDDKNPLVASEQLPGLTLSKSFFYSPHHFNLWCVFYWAVLIPPNCISCVQNVFPCSLKRTDMHTTYRLSCSENGLGYECSLNLLLSFHTMNFINIL